MNNVFRLFPTEFTVNCPPFNQPHSFYFTYLQFLSLNHFYNDISWSILWSMLISLYLCIIPNISLSIDLCAILNLFLEILFVSILQPHIKSDIIHIDLIFNFINKVYVIIPHILLNASQLVIII